jgi:NAD(P)H-hydrate epimerase
MLEIPFINEVSADCDIILDGVFGFSFADGAIREPFGHVLERFKALSDKIPIVSIDVPSGWIVDAETPSDKFMPETIISLTAPKLCTRSFKGRHFLGGRFVPHSFAAKYGLYAPCYVGAEQSVCLDSV